MPNKKMLEKAKLKLRALQKLRKDPRYLKTLGKLRLAGFLDVRDVPTHRGQVFLDDALWAAKLEPRIFELLPAIVARRPKFFAFLQLPENLNLVVNEIKRGQPVTAYQGIAPEKYCQWIQLVGRTDAEPKVMKAFRLSRDELAMLERLSERMSKSQTQILSEALRAYELRVS